jgi:hypothetical protein
MPTLHAGSQFLGNDRAEMLEGRKSTMELLECHVGDRIAKSVDEELRIENVLSRGSSHGLPSGGVMSIPSIARVPSTSSR